MTLQLHLRGATAAIFATMLCGCAGPGSGPPGVSSLDAVAIGEAPGVSAPRTPEAAAWDREGRAGSEAVPTAAEIFDFHPAGSRPGSWREPFVVSYSEGPLNGYRLRTLAELRKLRDHRYDLAPPSALAER